jgi:hypothetical protein
LAESSFSKRFTQLGAAGIPRRAFFFGAQFDLNPVLARESRNDAAESHSLFTLDRPDKRTES